MSEKQMLTISIREAPPHCCDLVFAREGDGDVGIRSECQQHPMNAKMASADWKRIIDCPDFRDGTVYADVRREQLESQRHE